MAVHQYWRVKTTSLSISGSYYTGIAEIIIKDVNGNDVTSVGSSISSSDEAGSSKDNAFDGNSSTLWFGSSTAGGWIGRNFGGSLKDVKDIYIMQKAVGDGTNPGMYYTGLDIEYSDDGVSYSTGKSFTALAAPTPSTYKLFSMVNHTTFSYTGSVYAPTSGRLRTAVFFPVRHLGI